MVLVFVLWLIVSRFCLWGWSFVWFLSPSSPDPCLVFCMGPAFFLCLVGFVDAVFSLSLSQALGKPKPFWFGFPLVFLRPARGLRLRPVLLPHHLHPGFAQPLFFFFLSSPSLVFRFGCFSVLVLVVLGVFVGAIVSEDFEGSRPCCCIAVTRCIMHGFGVGKGEED